MSEMPPPAKGPTPPPVPLTSFIGRDREIATVTGLVQRPDSRLITLTGPGGIGKTRLALQVVDQVGERFADGIAFVSLAPVRDPELVLSTIAQALLVPDAAGQPLRERLTAFLTERQMLLVLDNLEHLLEAAATLIAELLARCPDLTVLATSRVRLGISAEQVVPLAPLDVETARALFTVRSQAADAGYDVAPGMVPVIDAICDRLDRLPLAIELAAARTNVLPPQALLARLDHQLPLLTGGPRDAPDRQRDMRAAITWSHDLLPEPNQVLFRQLAVFVGGFTLEAAEAVADDNRDVLAGVSGLVAASLVAAIPGVRDEARFMMLETIREYALEQLLASGAEHAIRQRHATWYRDLTVALDTVLFTPKELDILDRFELEHGNFGQALGWFERTGDRESLLRLAGSLGPLWAMHGHGREGRYWLERAIGAVGDGQGHAMAVALRSLCRLLNQQAVGDRALALAERALALSRDEDDRQGIIYSLVLGGVASFRTGELERAMGYQAEALALLDTIDDVAWANHVRGIVLVQLGNYCIHMGAVADADAWYTRAAERQRCPGSVDVDALALAGLGDVARAQGDDALALQRYREGLRLSWDAYDLRAVAYALGGVAGALAAFGYEEPAACLFGASEALHDDLGVPFGVETFDRQRAFGLPEPWAAEGTSFGVAQRLRDALGTRNASLRRTVMDRSLIEPAWQTGRAMRALSGFPPDQRDTAFTAAWEAGRHLSWEDLLADIDALVDAFGEDADGSSTADPTHGLTPRETDVLRLLAEGRSNRAIGDALSISERTVENHVLHILTKLDLDSRTAAATWAVRHGLA